MRASTLAVATLSVLAAQGINQAAHAADVPSTVEPNSDSEQRAMRDDSTPAPLPVASLPEPQVQPQFSMTRLDTVMREPTVVQVQSAPGVTPAVQSSVSAPPEAPELVAQVLRPVPQTPGQPINIPVQVVESDNSAIPVVPLEATPATPPVQVTQQVDFSRPTPSYGPSGVSSRRLRSSRINFVSVTNRSGVTAEIELVGQSRPLVLLPGQTRRFAVRTRDTSLLYWVPTGPERRDPKLAARVSQVSGNSIAVTLVRSRFPSDNLAIYFPEPDSPAYTLKVF